MAKIFISHRGADAVEAERLAGEIRARGHEVWLDKWEIKIGDSIVQRIDAGLSSADYLIMCLSTSGSLAPWMSREWMSALAMQLEGRGIRLLPARLTGGELPAILFDTKYADLVIDWSKGVSEILAAIR